MGRPAKPAKLLLLNGRSEGKDSAGRPVATPPPFERCAPDPPGEDWFDEEARAEWERVTGELEPLGLLKAGDRRGLITWCTTWSRFVAATREYQRDGMIVVNPDSGNLRRHPAVGIAETAAAQLRAWASEFGLTPSAERRLGTFAPELDDSSSPYAG
jgi:P27 family predicted phage terminase small subunit